MIKLIMPKMGESVAEATILKWLKKEGDQIEADEPVLEIATDKVDSEVPSPTSGILSQCLFKEGDVVKVGETIAIINADQKEANIESKPVVPAIEKKEPVSGRESENGKSVQPVSTIDFNSSSHRFYSPLV